MSREIKFRAWDKKFKEMIFDIQTPNGPPQPYFFGYYLDNKGFDIMQFTGLKDKNGKEIYEGDIIEFDEKEWGGNDNIFFVSWNNDEGEWDWGGGVTSDMEWRTIIGNIYQNPELIKDE